MKLDKATIRFEIDDKSVEMDVLSLQMHIEASQDKHRDNANEVLQDIREIFSEFNVNLTDTQAWTVVQAAEAAYEKHKKKLRDTLESDFGTVPIHLRGPNKSLSGSTGSSPPSLQKESSSNGSQTENSPETVSEVSSMRAPGT